MRNNIKNEMFDICPGTDQSISYKSLGSYEVLEDIQSVNEEWLSRTAIATAINVNSLYYIHEHFAN